MAHFSDFVPQRLIESPLNNSVASFKKSVIKEIKITVDVTIKFSREPHPLYDPNSFVHNDQRQFLSDDELLQYDELVYVSIMREVA